MGALIILTAALAAQATTTTSSGTAPPTAEKTAGGSKAGELTYVDLGVGAGYSTNPQFSLNSHSGAGFGRVSLNAVHTRTSARSTTLLSLYAENDSYTRHYGSTQSVSFVGRHDAAVTEHLRVFGDVNASYQQGGQLDTRVLVVPLVPPLSGQPGVPILLPIGADFLTIRGKTYSLGGHAGAEVALSPHDNLSVSSGVERTIFHSGFARTSYTMIPVSLAYDRQLSERSTVGARLSAVDTEYNGPASVREITPQLTGRVQLSPYLAFSGAAGVSFARVDDGIRIRHSTGLSANASLCSTTNSGSFCGHVAIDQESATVAGPAKTISGGVDYTRRLDADSTLTFSLGVDHYSRPISIITGQAFSNSTYYRASGEYSRRVGRRLFGGVDLAVRKLTQAGPDPKADLNASLFLRYRFGDVQ